MKTTIATGLCFALVLSTFGQEENANDKKESPVRLDGPLVQVLSWDLRSPFPVDLDDDGRLDLLVINNDAARIELLYQRTAEELRKEAKERVKTGSWDPVIETAPFLEEKLLIGDRMFALAAVDFDEDGHIDIGFTGQREPFSLRFGDGKGNWEKGWTYDHSTANPSPDTMAIADVNGDGHLDIAVLSKGEFIIFPGGNGRNIPKPDLYRVSADGARGLKIADLDADGVLDATYLNPGSERERIFRSGLGDGSFGAEMAIPGKLGSPEMVIVPPADEETPPSLATVKPTFSEIHTAPIEERGEEADQSNDLQAENYPVPRSGSSAAIPATGDFDGDGIGDVAMADPDGARILVWFGAKNGNFKRPLEFPALARATSLSRVRNGEGKRDSLLICSTQEGIAGISTVTENNRLPFPKPIPAAGEPLVAAGVDLDGDGIDEVVVAVKDGLRLEAVIAKRNAAGDGWEQADSVKIASIKRGPEGILTDDIDGDGDGDVVLMIPKEPAHLLLGDGQGGLSIGAEESPLRNGQFMDVSSADLGIGDFDGDGKPNILIAKEGFVRAFRVTENGDLEVVDQGNARQGNDRISGPVILPGDPRRLLFYDPEAKALQILQREEDGAFRYSQSRDTGLINLTAARLDGPEDNRRLLIFGRDRFWALPLGGDTWTMANGTTFRSQIERVRYHYLTAGDLNQDKTPELVAIDGNMNLLQILHREDDEWKSAFHFKVFQDSPFRGRGQPRGNPQQPHAPLIADFNNDGLNDLLVLCHNRLLLYTGMEKE
ncbi:MAG: VCBS repeat-containing protein [Verrucomicrobiales bacterium]|nr:VCBS repeat-containing protein [Verrucomicrobiales bacterium]